MTTHGHILMGCLTITVIYQNRIFAFLIIMIINAMPGEGLVWFLIPAPLWLPPIGTGGSLYQLPASPPSLGSIGPVTKWKWPSYQLACSIVYTQLLLGYGHCCCYHF
jgi:hypothetical protein